MMKYSLDRPENTHKHLQNNKPVNKEKTTTSVEVLVMNIELSEMLLCLNLTVSL